MKKWFNNPGFAEFDYERPNQKWICGRRCEGRECVPGPSPGGKCETEFECSPKVLGTKDGKPNFVCNRTRHGSTVEPCQEGPTAEGVCCQKIEPCRPVRSLRSKRGMLVLGTMLAVTGALLLFLAQQPVKLISPGELTNAHSAAGTDCADCHGDAKASPEGGASVASLFGATAHVTSQHCQECHPMGAAALHPHSLPSAQLQEITARVTGGAPAVAVAHHAKSGGLACTSCHTEHRGKQYDLKQLANRQCQVCHAQQFANFEHGHPSFGDYPFKRRTQIVFDHQKHYQTHFKTKKELAPERCQDCHEMDGRGELMRVKDYEHSCAACHDGDFGGLAADAPKIDFVNVPPLDAEVMADEEIAIGQWPLNWDGSFAVELSPVIGFLLQQSSNHSHAVHQILAKKLELDYLEEPEDLRHGFHLAWGVKQLLYELTEEGVPALVKRIEAALKRRLTSQEKKELEQVISPEFFVETVQLWFPNLYDDVEAHLDDDSPEAELYEPDEDNLSRKPVSIGGNWFRSDTQFSLSYRPVHHADPFMKLWLEFAANGKLADGARHTETNSVARLFTALSGSASEAAAGRCIKCHTTDVGGDLRWRGRRMNLEEKGFTRFSHRAHLSLLEEDGCRSCHPLAFEEKERPYLSQFAYHASQPIDGFVSGFRAVKKAHCATCHTKEQAGDSCLSCHNYHVGHFEAP